MVEDVTEGKLAKNNQRMHDCIVKKANITTLTEVKEQRRFVISKKIVV